MNSSDVWGLVQKVREKSPLVHNITNYVVMNNTANALLSIGASPVMAHAIDEVEDMVMIASALVINIGTLSENWIESMSLAMKAAKLRNIPIVIDPVGAGATKYRTETVLKLINEVRPSVIRGNASEIMALVDSSIKTKGVDSSSSTSTARSYAEKLATEYKCVVVISGPQDIITDGNRTICVNNGNEMMPKVTGLGCTATALVGAFCAVHDNYLIACVSAMAVMGIAGEIAVQTSNGPSSLQMNFIDKLYTLSEVDVVSHLRLS